MTVFTSKDLSLLWEKTDAFFLKKKIYRYVKDGKLLKIRRGIYSIKKEYDKRELATKIMVPSYISLETVLEPLGIVPKDENKIIFVVSRKNYELEYGGQKYLFHKINDVILNDQVGIENKNNYRIATPERAMLDLIYLHRKYEFENLYGIDWNKINKILPIYAHKKRVTKDARKLYRSFILDLE